MHVSCIYYVFFVCFLLPGNLEVEMTYRLEDETNALVIEYRATTDKATVVNLTNHGFFNLAGIANPTPTVLNHIITINADHYTPIDEVSIPTGEILKVEGTPMDFRTPHAIGERIDDKFQQLVNGAGYDHCYVLNKTDQIISRVLYEYHRTFQS